MNRHWDETVVQADATFLSDRDASATRAANDQTPRGEMHLLELIGILRRRRRLILKVTLWGVALVFAAAMLIPPKYTAKAQVAVELPSGSSQTVAPGRDESAVETHMQMLISREHLERVLDDLLDRRPEPAAQDKANDPARRAPFRVPSAGWLPGPSELVKRISVWTGKVSSLGQRSPLDIEQFKRDVAVNQEARSRIIGIAYTSTDPETAAIIANRIVQLYVQDRKQQRQDDARAELGRLAIRIASLKRDIEGSNAAARELMLQHPAGTNQAAKPQDNEQDLQELERQAVSNSQLYQFLLQRQQQIRDQEEVVEPDVHILSLAATPVRPSSPNPFLFILPALVLFSIGGSLLSVLLERLDRGLRSASAVNDALGIPCIGLVPQIAQGRSSPTKYSNVNPAEIHAEALRSVIATMQLTSRVHAPKVVLIASSLPDEGKTTLALNLSTSIALLGRRVLLIDLDISHPSTLPEPRKDIGRILADVLFQDRAPEQVIKRIPELGLDYLAVDLTAVEPLILFSGTEMPRFLDQLRGSYDCIIINGLPLLGNSTARILAPLADETLLVVKWGSTRRELAQNALAQLRGTGAPTTAALKPYPVSAVITQVDLDHYVRDTLGEVGSSPRERKSFLSSLVKWRPPFGRRAPDTRGPNNLIHKAAEAFRALKTRVVQGSRIS